MEYGLLLLGRRTTGNGYGELQRDSMGDESINVVLIDQSIDARRSLLFNVFPPLPIAYPVAILIISTL
jgi:hypothetical protein